MPRVSLEPLASPLAGESFLQTVRLTEGKDALGWARWHAAEPSAGAAQILDFTILPPYRRQGHGGRLLKAVIDQCTAYHSLHQSRLRRIWVAVGQKDQVIARAFLVSQGFHHVASLTQLLRDQDALIYTRAFD